MKAFVLFVVALTCAHAQLPPVIQAIDVPQYSSWDRWNDTHPLFSSSALTVTLNCSQIVSANYTPCVMDIVTPSWAIRNVSKVAVRKHGHTVGYRVSLDHYVSGRTIFDQTSAFVVKRGVTYGLERWPVGIVAERLGARVLRAMGVPVQRMGLANVTVHGGGAFSESLTMVIMEWVDEAFIKSRFGSDAWESCGLWKEGGDRLGGGGARSPFAKTPKFQALYQAALQSANTGDSHLTARVDVEEFNRVYAATSAMDAADGENENAFFVWIASTARFSVIRYDLELSFIDANAPKAFFCGGNSQIALPVGVNWCLGLIEQPSFQNSLRILLASPYWNKQVFEDIRALVSGFAAQLEPMFASFVRNRTSFLTSL